MSLAVVYYPSNQEMHQYRGVEQLEARRAHNPEVVGSSPASATKISPNSSELGVFYAQKLVFLRM